MGEGGQEGPAGRRPDLEEIFIPSAHSPLTSPSYPERLEVPLSLSLPSSRRPSRGLSSAPPPNTRQPQASPPVISPASQGLREGWGTTRCRGGRGQTRRPMIWVTDTPFFSSGCSEPSL